MAIRGYLINGRLYDQGSGGLGVLWGQVGEGKALTVSARLLCTKHCARLLTQLDFIWLFLWLLCKFGGLICIFK